MKNQAHSQSLESALPVVMVKDVVSRRNQDGTVIIMKLNESNLFYKLTDLAAAIWPEYEYKISLQDLQDKYAKLFPEDSAQMSQDLEKFHQELLRLQLITSASQNTAVRANPLAVQYRMDKGYRFGEVKEYNLEQIETEVLSESLYLDVFAGSDMRLKKDIAPIRDALPRVLQLNGVQFSWKNEEEGKNTRQAGLIAQDVATVMPELVRRDSVTGMLAIDYSKLNSYLIEAIRELHHRVEELECRCQSPGNKSMH